MPKHHMFDWFRVEKGKLECKECEPGKVRSYLFGKQGYGYRLLRCLECGKIEERSELAFKKLWEEFRKARIHRQ